MKQTLEIERPKTVRSVWRHRDLRVIAPARALSVLGDDVALVALLLASHDRGWGTTGVAALLGAAALPIAVGAPWAGRLVDAVDSRWTTSVAALWQGLCAAALAVVVLGDPRPWTFGAVLALVAALGVGQAVTAPAWQALVPHVVEPAEVPRAVASLQASTTLAMVGGPALGGFLVAWHGTSGALVVQAVTFAALAAAALTVRTRRRAQPGSSGDAGDDGRATWAGYAVLRRDAVLGPLVLGLLGIVLAVQLVVVVEVFLVRDVLHAGAAGYGAVGAVTAAAMVVGSLAAGRVGVQRRQLAVVVGGFAVICLAVLLGGLAPTLIAFGATMALLGLANGALNACLTALLLQRVPDTVRGRVGAAVSGAAQACTLVGMVVGGVAGGIASPRTVFVVAGAVGLVVSAAVAVVVARAARRVWG